MSFTSFMFVVSFLTVAFFGDEQMARWYNMQRNFCYEKHTYGDKRCRWNGYYDNNTYYGN